MFGSKLFYDSSDELSARCEIILNLVLDRLCNLNLAQNVPCFISTSERLTARRQCG